MKKLTRLGVIALALFVAGPAGAQPMPVAAPPGGLDVNVVNPLPLPVTVEGEGTVLVKNVDEPGQQPYEAYIEFFVTGCIHDCENFTALGATILLDGPEVPADKRLVVQYVTAALPNTGSAEVVIGLQRKQIVALQRVKWAFFGPFFALASGDLQAFSSEAFATYGPGERPHINMRLPAANNILGSVTLAGYLIDAVN